MNLIDYEKNITALKSKNYTFISDYLEGLKTSYVENELSEDDLKEIIMPLKNDTRRNVQNLVLKTENFIEKREKEILRVKGMYSFDKSYISSGLLCGVDEVGRGPLAGPIVAAAVILDLSYLDNKDLLLGIKDSKKLSAKQREELSKIIKARAVSYSIAELDNNSIDTKGIAWCNNEVFKLAVNGLKVIPQLVLTDGYGIKDFNLQNKHVIKGDEKSASIACASIVAKVYRDNLMKELSREYAHYAFESNAGYGSQEHIEAIKKYGISKIHRKSFLTNILQLWKLSI